MPSPFAMVDTAAAEWSSEPLDFRFGTKPNLALHAAVGASARWSDYAKEGYEPLDLIEASLTKRRRVRPMEQIASVRAQVILLATL
jgi:hypothetical protein